MKKAKATATPSYVPSYPEIDATPKQAQIDLDGLKREIAEFAKLAAEQSASQVETKVKFSQDEMKEEVDRVVELVRVFISQSEAERATLTAELERLQKYTNYFAERIDKISDEVSVVDQVMFLI
ncbi:Oidioi.mRNA.OKI2018_I69.PAR.g9081.t1.cds [Oikopleura dioica]|uniref:Oidioi.mRNA.OKI2018_I69.PAR.g9081.t1.cds n=1 Tax=Oikopleura dioica TaxID=34765 RepID=A0ABN7RNC1_OIKDI|nr:Oidioi.mRNA.OKI2018_I69.PAR.g9081.t1.cds [Oikopleura dioica]